MVFRVELFVFSQSFFKNVPLKFNHSSFKDVFSIFLFSHFFTGVPPEISPRDVASIAPRVPHSIFSEVYPQTSLRNLREFSFETLVKSEFSASAVPGIFLPDFF